MLGRLFLAFTLVTLAELWLLIKLGQLMGLWGTLALVFGTGFVGAWLARFEGLRVLSRARAELLQRRVPTDSLLDGVLVLIAGAFLITPGVLTDMAGLGLLVRPIRAPFKRWLSLRLRRWVARGDFHVVVGPDIVEPSAPRGARQGEVVDVRTEPTGAEDGP